MSDTDGTEVKKEIQTDIIKVKVDRSGVEKDLQNEVIKEKTANEKLHQEFAKLQEQLKQFEEKDTKEQEEKEKLIAERDSIKSELNTIAMNKFKEVKAQRLELFGNLGMEEDKIKELDEQIQTPADLAEKEWMFEFLSGELSKAAKEREEAKKKEEEGEGETNETVPDATNPPGGSTVTLPPPPAPKKGVYQTARAGIDDLYERTAKGDKEAEKDLERLWRKFAPTIRNRRTTFSVSQCPACEAGILQGEECQYCGWKPELWKMRGGEIF